MELHHKAAYLLVIQNLTNTLSRMPELFHFYEIETVMVRNKKGRMITKEVKKLKTFHSLPTMEKCFKRNKPLAMNILMQYVAAAHNNPKYANE